MSLSNHIDDDDSRSRPNVKSWVSADEMKSDRPSRADRVRGSGLDGPEFLQRQLLTLGGAQAAVDRRRNLGIGVS